MPSLPDLSHLSDITQPGGDPRALFGELMWAIRHTITHQPRSLQTKLGPSELGCPCARWLGYRLAGVEPVNVGRVSMAPVAGVELHTWFARILAWLNRHLGDQETGPRFLVELPVDVGEIDGSPVTGHCDAYCRCDACAVDLKVVGGRALDRYRRHGPGAQYRTQVHLYGRGIARRGLPAHTVAILFLPRDRDLDQAYWWYEPYDEQIAINALSRVEGIGRLVEAAGAAVTPVLPTADHYCASCPFFLPAATDLAQACPGDPRAFT